MSKIVGSTLGAANSSAPGVDGDKLGATMTSEAGHLGLISAASGMNRDRRPVHIPVRVQQKETPVQKAQDVERTRENAPARESRQQEPGGEQANRPAQAGPEAAAPDLNGEGSEWRDRALRLQAEMENFRKRQQRLAEERVAEERERLISQFAAIADDLERALEAGSTSLTSLREGVALTHQALLRLLAREGVDPIHPQGEAFDPAWHEAVSTVPHTAVGVPPNTVVKVVRDGYRVGDRLVRPARVIVAV